VILGNKGAIFLAADSVKDSGKMTLNIIMRRPLLKGSGRDKHHMRIRIRIFSQAGTELVPRWERVSK
jgi:hypothetical protein